MIIDIIDIIGEQSEGSVATARVETAAGTIMVMAEVTWRDGA
jgi:hypothetical protein